MSLKLENQVAYWFQNNQALLIEHCVNIVSALLILVIGILIARVISSAIYKIMQKKQVDGIVASFTSNMTKYLILAFVMAAALNRIGIQTASLVAVIGAAGLAIGLALQGSLSNFAAGVLLIIFRPFKKGELVEISGIAGTVEFVHIFTTVIFTPDHKMVVVPNNNILSDNIINYSRTGRRRVDLVIGVSYSSDLKKTRAVIEQVLQSDERVLKDPSWTIGVLALADSSVNFAVRPWVKSRNYWDVYFSLHEDIKIALDEAGIEIPFPQRDIHLIQKEAVRK